VPGHADLVDRLAVHLEQAHAGVTSTFPTDRAVLTFAQVEVLDVLLAGGSGLISMNSSGCGSEARAASGSSRRKVVLRQAVGGHHVGELHRRTTGAFPSARQYLTIGLFCWRVERSS
jgi:hypothetical protein